MAVEVASLKAVLELDKGNFESGLSGAKKELGSFGSTMQNMLSSAGGFLVAQGVQMGLSAITSGIQSSITAAREAIAINKDLEQTIVSTGGAAGVTADAARDLADSLSRVTNFEDDAIVKGEAMLLTFTNIGSDVFPRATEAMLDMAQKFGSMDSASVQLGKALNDPLKGISALQRVGVTFSETQKEQIKNFMAVNDIASSQGIILDELAREFGGQARAMADPITQLGNAWGNLQEKFGVNVLIPLLNSLAQVVLPGLLAVMDNFKLSISGLSSKELASLQQAFTEIMSATSAWWQVLGELGTALADMARAIGLADKNSTGLGVAMSALAAVLKVMSIPLYTTIAVFNVLAVALSAVSAVLGTFFNLFRAAGQALGEWGAKSAWVASVTGGITSALQTLSGWINQVQLGWQRLIATMSQAVNLPPALTPGSPTPFEIGLHGIANAINSMPPLSSGFGGSVPMAAGGGGSSTININIGGVSASTTTNGDAPTEAIRMTLQLLREQLGR